LRNPRNSISAPSRAGLFALSAVVAVGALQPPAFAGANGNPQIQEVTVTRTADGAHDLSWTTRKPGQVFVYASTDPADPSRSGTLVARTTASTVRITTLDTTRRWYFEVAPRRAANAEGPVAGTRHIALDGPLNTRDLGGYPTLDGRTVRWGKIYRSDDLAEATEADKARLSALNLSTSVDFRGQPEIDQSGPNRLPENVAQVHIPLLDESGNALSAAITAALASGDPTVLEEMLGNGKAAEIPRDGYRRMATNQAAQEGFRNVLLRLAEDPRLPLIYNCTAGKDRTGVMSAVILTLLRVPRETVLADYTLSNTYLAPSHQRTYAFLSSQGIDTSLIRPLLEQRPEYLEAFFEGIEAAYGSFDHYLRKALRLDQKTITHLRHTLTTH